MASSWKSSIGALLGISAYTKPPLDSIDLDDANVERIRAMQGGQLAPLPFTQTRWFLRDLESAIHAADAGDISWAARLYKAFRRDGILAGLLSTRTGGLVRLPKRFSGDPDVVEALERRDGLLARSMFEDMCPSAELALMAADGIALGIAVGELVPVEGRDFPVLVRIDPEFLRYRWNENRWYYSSIAGQIPITPGDGRWVLHVPGGRMTPWQHGLWTALGQAWINKQHALLHRSNYSAKLANAARAVTGPIGATEDQRIGMLAQVAAWGVNSTFELPIGWDVKLIESNGRGFDVFQEEITTCDTEAMIALAGQVVTTTGGTGFANADIHKSIRADLIQETADGLSYTLNTQVIPQFVFARWGLSKLQKGGAVVEWDVTPPKDVKAEAESLKAFADALTLLTTALAPYGGRKVDIGSLTAKYGIPIAQDTDGDGNPDVNGVENGDVDVDLAELEDEPANDIEDATVDAKPEPSAEASLAQKMTEHGVTKCEHGSSNRCRLCGVERVRDFDPGEDGEHQWRVQWRPIEKAEAAE